MHLESVHTEAGGVHGSFHDAIVRARVLGGESESVGQGLGRSPTWPAGDRPYVFGSLLFEEVDRVRLGVAVPLEVANGSGRRASVYLQTGWSF